MSSNPLARFVASDLEAAPGGSQIDAILDAVRHHLGMEIAFASRYVGARREFTHLRTDLPLPVGPGDGDAVEDTFCWHILHGRLPELIADASDFEFAQRLPITRALPVGCHMNVPLRLRDGSVYGSFCCVSRTPDRSLTARDLSVMRVFADLASNQIEAELEAGRARDAAVGRISGAMASGKPAILLQPIHQLADGLPVGCEALSRFGDGQSPALWFAEAAEVGLGVELELAAVGEALQALAFVPAPLYLSINASPQLIMSGRLADALAAVPPGKVVIEVTEHEAVEDYRALKAALAPLRDRVRLAVDDVGAGYAGLRHILDTAPEILKLDMSLTRDVDRDPARRALIRAMVDFAASIGSTIVAEGIERAGEAAVLRELGIGYGQGWHFSRPMAVVAAQHVLLGAARETEPHAPEGVAGAEAAAG